MVGGEEYMEIGPFPAMSLFITVIDGVVTTLISVQSVDRLKVSR